MNMLGIASLGRWTRNALSMPPFGRISRRNPQELMTKLQELTGNEIDGTRRYHIVQELADNKLLNTNQAARLYDLNDAGRSALRQILPQGNQPVTGKTYRDLRKTLGAWRHSEFIDQRKQQPLNKQDVLAGVGTITGAAGVGALLAGGLEVQRRIFPLRLLLPPEKPIFPNEEQNNTPKPSDGPF